MKLIPFSLFLLLGVATNLFSQPTPESDPLVVLQQPAGDINGLLDYYEVLSGKILIRDASLPIVPSVKLVAPNQIPRSQALRLIESVLVLNGYTLVPGEDKSMKVIGSNKQARSEGIPIFANLADLPKGDQVVSYFMPLRHISATDALQIFLSSSPPHPQYGAYVPVVHAQALILTDNASSIRQLVTLKELVDVPPAKVISKFVSLQRADAERVAEVITKLIENRKAKSQGSGGGGGGQSPVDNSGLPPDANPVAAGSGAGTAMALSEKGLVAGDVELVADARTNRILVITRPVNFDYIQNLISEFDTAVILNEPLERALKYVMASDVLPILETLLMENTDSAGGSSQGNSSPNQNQRNPTNPNPGGGANRQGGEGISTERTLSEASDTAPEAIMVGKTRIIADKQANSIIVIGPPESLLKVSATLDRLDKKPLQVYLSTVIGQLSLNDNSELAVDLLQKFSTSGNLGVASSVRNRTSGGAVFSPDPKVLTAASAFASAASGLTIYGAIGSALDYYVQALQGSGRFRVISRPVIYTANNKIAIISSGQQIAVPASTLTSLNTGNNNQAAVTSNIDYKNVELKLEIIPLINSDREVTLQIKQTNDSIVGSQVISGNAIPTIGTQFIDTTITVKNLDTIVLGGLITDDSTRSETGVPILKDIPLIGYLFKGVTKEKKRSELIILIQPNVIGSDDEAMLASDKELSRTKVGADAKATSENTPLEAELKKRPKEKLPTPTKAPRGLTTPRVEEAAPRVTEPILIPLAPAP